MKCPGCEYELWNLKAGPCPECGRPFKPSEFDFLANAVKFCCPEPTCQQAYYGTGERGELVPSEFDCVSCGKHQTIDDMLLLPADALGQREPTRSTNPWLDPHRKRRWLATVLASLGQPGRMLEATPVLGTTGKALVFALLNIVIASALLLVLSGLMMFSGSGAGSIATTVLFAVLGPAAYLFVWTAVTHGLLKVFGQPTPDGIGRTFQALAFTSGSWLFSIIPCLGWLLGFIAWSVSGPIAVRSAHQCRGWAAYVATLATPVLTFLTVVGTYFGLIFWGLSMAHTVSSSPGLTSVPQLHWQVVDLADELRAAINANNPPTHGASLLGPASPVLYTAFSDQQHFDAPIGFHTASSLDAMSDADRASALAAITVSWPADITAHRVGRIIFTHHGVPPSGDPGLWLLIELPVDPSDTTIDVASLNGSAVIPDDPVARQFHIDQQNRLRVSAGLPPLPSFQTLTSNTGPWTAADGVAPPPP